MCEEEERSGCRCSDHCRISSSLLLRGCCCHCRTVSDLLPWLLPPIFFPCLFSSLLLPLMPARCYCRWLLCLGAINCASQPMIAMLEKLIVNTLNFNISVPTPYVFMRRFLKAANSDKKLELLSFFIIELCLVEYGMLKFQPSLLAAAAIYTAQSALVGLSHWNRTSELHTCYMKEQLLECSRMMVDFHQKAGIGKLTGVHRKYSTFRYGFVAKCEPALFLLDTRP